MTAVPDAAAVVAYLGSGYTTAQVTPALAAEKAAQAHRCRVPLDTEDWPDDLVEALKRRVARHLSMKALPLGIQSDEMGSVRLGSTDPEVRRLEAPYRKVRVG